MPFLFWNWNLPPRRLFPFHFPSFHSYISTPTPFYEIKSQSLLQSCSFLFTFYFQKFYFRSVFFQRKLRCSIHSVRLASLLSSVGNPSLLVAASKTVLPHVFTVDRLTSNDSLECFYYMKKKEILGNIRIA